MTRTASLLLKNERHSSLPKAVAAAVVLVCTGASAFTIESDNPDVEIRFDNSVRYNLGTRVGENSARAYNTSSYDESNSKFSRGDIVTNRVDLLSEFDVVLKKRYGFRVSGAAWYDQAYNNNSATTPNPAFGGAGTAYPNSQYTEYVKRWNAGPSGEILDAFVFGGFDVGSIPVDLKIGQHTVYWGESLFSFVHGASYSQGPVDARKAYTNPGVEAKELFLPLNQISGTAQLAPNFSVAAQYFLDWAPTRLPDGGTYLGLMDALSVGGGTYLVNPAAFGGATSVPFAGIVNKPKTQGDWGVRATWRPEALGGTVGFTYREYTDKIPQLVLGGLQSAPFGFLPSDVRLDYLEGARLIGLSLSKEFGGVSIGAEVNVRQNGALLMNAATLSGQSPRGDTTHALVNALTLLPPNSIWNSASIAAELTYSRLDRITANAQNYNGVGYGCLAGNPPAPSSDYLDGCATKDAWGFAIKFEPVWYQAFSGVDLKMPIVYQTGLKGNSPVVFGGYEGNGSYSVGLTGEIKNKYTVALAYNGYFTKAKDGPSNSIGNVNGLGYLGSERDWISLTLKSTF
jgi:hypothetical protein